jgi:hypothetical protein
VPLGRSLDEADDIELFARPDAQTATEPGRLLGLVAVAEDGLAQAIER